MPRVPRWGHAEPLARAEPFTRAELVATAIAITTFTTATLTTTSIARARARVRLGLGRCVRTMRGALPKGRLRQRGRLQQA